jgi:hypothetical protein
MVMGLMLLEIVAPLNNGINVVGAVPGASVKAVLVCHVNGGCSTSDWIAGIEHVYINGKKGDVVNISLRTIGSPPYILNAAVESTASLGIKFAIAAGNDSIYAYRVTPASAYGVNINTVSCYDQIDSLCSFSNFGKVVDVGGPGQEIQSLSLSGGLVTYSGTSMSAPHIAGLLFANSIKTDGTVRGDRDAYPDPIAVYAGVTPTPNPPASNNLQFYILPNSWSGTETSWALTRNSPGPPVVVASRALGTCPYSGPNDGYISTVSDLPVGSYRFDLYDGASDGLFPPAGYMLSLGDGFDGNGIVLKSGESFKNIDTTFFTVCLGSSTLQDVTIETKKLLS